MSRTRIAFLVLLAIAAYVVLNWLWLDLEGNVDPDTATWLSLLYAPFSALASIAAPFVLGYVVRSYGFLLGALVGALAGPIGICLVGAKWGSVTPSADLVALLLSSAVGAALLGSVSAAAGVLASQRRA